MEYIDKTYLDGDYKNEYFNLKHVDNNKYQNFKLFGR